MAQQALTRYGFEQAKLTLLNNVSTPIVRVDVPAGRFVLRIHDPAQLSRDELRSELHWLLALHRDLGIVVPLPLTNRDGELLTEVTSDAVPGPRVIVLFHWVEGTIREASLGAKEFRAVGKFMAGLHEHSRRFQPPPGFTRPRLNWGWLFGPQAPLGTSRAEEVFSRKERALFQCASEHIRLRMEALGEGPEVFGMIHSDLHQYNYLFYRDEVRAIDFQDCGWGYYLFDMAPTFSEALERENVTEAEWAVQRAAFLEGYQSIRALPHDYEEQLQLFELVRQIDLVNWVLSWPTLDLRDWGPEFLRHVVEALERRFPVRA
jgi:Ser/Thr protein kinase RdoA (MazF antagonist)